MANGKKLKNMLSLFKKKEKGPVYKDIIWIDTKAKQLQFITFIKKEIAQRPVYIISSFHDSLLDIEGKLKAVGMDVKRMEYISDWNQDNRIFTLHSKILSVNESPNPDIQAGLILFLEHYPLPDHDVVLMKHAIDKLMSNEIRFYLSLDDPLFATFGGERIQEMMRKLGIEENEPLEHSMISQSITNAQKKLAKDITRASYSENENEWYKKNVRPSN